MSGANTAISAPAAASAQSTCEAVAVPAISVRVAVTRWLTGLTSLMLSRLMFEAMREAERDAVVRERMSAMLTQYRELMIRAIRAEQERGAVFTGAPADAIATLLGAVGDGLLLHALLDPELDVHAALNALRALLAPRPS